MTRVLLKINFSFGEVSLDDGGLSIMSLTLALLELRKFSFIRDLTRNTEIEKTTV